MIQGGGFEVGMKQKPTNPLDENEAKNGLKNVRYALAMHALAILILRLRNSLSIQRKTTSSISLVKMVGVIASLGSGRRKRSGRQDFCN